MAIIVNTNMPALRTQANLNKATNGLNSALERMSTGLKINSAKDDAAGLYVATKMETQIRGNKVAQNNIATASNVLSTAEGDLDTILGHLNRIRDLAVQASNSVYDADSKQAMNKEVQARIEEIDRIAKVSNFNGLHLLSDEAVNIDTLRVQVGANKEATANAIFVTGVFGSASSDTLGIKAGAENAFINADCTNAATYIGTVDTAIQTISTKKSAIGAVQNRLDAALDSLTTTIENATASKSTIMDADIATESMEFTRQQILQQTSSALLAQANQLPAIALNLIQ